jgi:hypothetical protein
MTGEQPVLAVMLNSASPQKLSFRWRTKGCRSQLHLYSLNETAKANGLELFGYFRYIFERIPLIDNPVDYKKLLPQNLDNTMIGAATTPV